MPRNFSYLPKLLKRLLVPLLIILLAWDALWTFLGVRPLFPWQLQEEMDKGSAGPVLLNVRTQKEYEWLHLPGARLTPFKEALEGQVPAGKNQTLVVICMTGHRSPVVAYRLQKLGFKEVYNLTWGMAGWEVYRRLTGASPGRYDGKPENWREQARMPVARRFL